MRIVAIILLPVFVLSFGEAALATPITVSNPSFESPTIPEGGNSTTTDDWGLTNMGGAYGMAKVFNLSDPSTLLHPITATEGQNIAAIAYHGLIIQTLGATLAANTNYTLTVDVGKYDGYEIPWTDNPGGGTYFNGKSGLYIGYNHPSGWFVGSLASKQLNLVTYTEGGFTEVEVIFSTDDSPPGLGKELWIALYALGATNSYVAFDNVRLEATTVTIPPAIPTLSEWGMVILFILLVVSALWVIRRKTMQEWA